MAKPVIGICAMESKARSKPMRNILDRLLGTGLFEVIVFGDKVILDEAISSWPACDFFISFYSNGFPLQKAIDYVDMQHPFCLNDLHMQQVLLDRRLVLAVLDSMGIPTPSRLMTWNRDFPSLTSQVKDSLIELGIDVQKLSTQIMHAQLSQDGDSIEVEGSIMKKPFVEKPISSEDHNINIYYNQAQGGGVRRLFRKVQNKSSEFLKDVVEVRNNKSQSYIYEEFLNVDNAEDVKVYTLGPNFAHAETRASPCLSNGIVKRTVDGKELRYITNLSDTEQIIAKKVCTVFKQFVCGFDLLRVNGESFVIDVNGWSFVKGNSQYYDKSAQSIKEVFLRELKKKRVSPLVRSLSGMGNQWTMKGFFAVMRHGDRTPKQKLKFTFKHAPNLLLLMKDVKEEIVLKQSDDVKKLELELSKALEVDSDPEEILSLQNISQILSEKGYNLGTKVQLRPCFDKETRELKKIQVILKWGGTLTHGGAYHSHDLGMNLRTDLNIINPGLLKDVKIYSSSEMRVISTAESFCTGFLESLPADGFICISKEMLDDSNAAKDHMDEVKRRLQAILNPEHPATPPAEFVMPLGMHDFVAPIQDLISLLNEIRIVLKQNRSRPMKLFWCTPESVFLFEERWEKLFHDLCGTFLHNLDVERSLFEPSKISELYDSLKFDLLHNRAYISHVFESGSDRDFVRELYRKSKEIFDIIGPHEYGIENSEKLLIGIRNTAPLLKQILCDMDEAVSSSNARTRLYFTKESKVYCILNALLLCGLKTKIVPTDIPELDYLTQITFELYERIDPIDTKTREYSLRIGLSHGAHDSNLIDLQLTKDHSISVAPRR